jgi:hypothetical protein
MDVKEPWHQEPIMKEINDRRREDLHVLILLVLSCSTMHMLVGRHH